MSTARPTSCEVAERVIQGMPWDNLSSKDWSGLSNVVAQALDDAWKQGMERAAEIVEQVTNDPERTTGEAFECRVERRVLAAEIRLAKERG